MGNINESDFTLAESTQSIILGFSTDIEPKVKKLLDKSSIRCETFKIIYEILDRIKELLEGLLDPILEERVLGHAEIKEIFNLTKQGRVAGCMIMDGKAVRGSSMRVQREGELVFEAELNSLKRFKDDATEVLEGYECGIGIDNFAEFKEQDIIEVYELKEVKRKLS